jgi:hypothetical protein
LISNLPSLTIGFGAICGSHFGGTLIDLGSDALGKVV